MNTSFNNILDQLGHANSDQIATANHLALVSNTSSAMNRGRSA